MSLVEEREAWYEDYQTGKSCASPLLEEYRWNRNSNSWRSSRAVEELCEYILFLEDKLWRSKDGN